MTARLGPIGWLILGFFAYGLTQFTAEAAPTDDPRFCGSLGVLNSTDRRFL